MNSDHKAVKRLIFGTSGSGKSTMFKTLVQSPGYKYRFVFDWDLKIATELGWQAAVDVRGLCRLLDAGRPVVFYPEEMFSDLEDAWGFFCRFVLDISKRLKGKKLLAGDEAQLYTTTNHAKFQASFLHLLNYGRNHEIDILLAAQRIDGLNKRVTGQLTEIYVFKHADTDNEAFEELRKIGIDPDQVKALHHPSVSGKVSWIYRHCLTGRQETITHAISKTH